MRGLVVKLGRCCLWGRVGLTFGSVMLCHGQVDNPTTHRYGIFTELKRDREMAVIVSLFLGAVTIVVLSY